jgi:acetolactate synthase-1/2/3 large subunit
MKASDVISNFLLDRGINTVFGIIGSANSHIYDSFAKAGISIFNVHNEQAAVLAAGAYYRTSGRVAVSLITAGGGATNAVTGIVSLWADSIPTLILSGQESTMYLRDHANRRMYGTQGFNFVKMMESTTKRAVTVFDHNSLQDELETAYAVANDGRKGPVLIDLPFDIQSKSISQRPWNQYVPSVVSPTDEQMNRVFELLKNSERPVILGGHGIKLSGSNQLFKSVINYTKIPVLLTWSAIDVLGHDHPLFCGSPGIYGQRAANFIFQKSDLIIVIGSRLTLPQTGYDVSELARSATIVMVDIDDTEFKDLATVKIHADCGAFLRKFTAYEYERPEWLDECKNLCKTWPLVEDAHKDTEFPNSYRVIDRISDFLTPDHVVVTDMGTALLSGHQAIRLKEGTKMFSSYGLGEMGYGLPAAFGAAVASQGREVLCLNCDGGMMMNLQELQTIIQHKLRVKIVIFNNDGYLMIKHTQKMLFDNLNAVNKDTGIVLPDYIKLANAFGYENYRIKSWTDFDFYFPQFMNYDGPAICEIYMPPTQDFIPKVKGVLQKDGSIFAPPIEEMSPVLTLDSIKSTMGDLISKKSFMISRSTQER